MILQSKRTFCELCNISIKSYTHHIRCNSHKNLVDLLLNVFTRDNFPDLVEKFGIDNAGVAVRYLLTGITTSNKYDLPQDFLKKLEEYKTKPKN